MAKAYERVKPGALMLQKDVARFLGVSEPTLRRYVQRGLIRPAAGTRFARAEVERFAGLAPSAAPGAEPEAGDGR
jgi:hypothetical protein